MPRDFHRARYILPKLKRSDYLQLMKTINNSLSLEVSDVAAFRSKVLSHYYRYGLNSALDAFNVKKSTLYDWKKSYEKSDKRVGALIPKSTRPHQTRKMCTDWRLVEFIKVFRETYGNIGKDKVKIFLDAYATELGTPSLGKTTIGKIIKRKDLFESRSKIKRKRAFKYTRTNKSPKVIKPGYLEIDSVVVYVNKERHNFICVIDIYTKYAVVLAVPTPSSKQALRALKLFTKQYPYRTHTVQSDNGSEFLKVFHQYLDKQKIKHQFIYPRCPKINGVVERFNRTIQEEFIQRSDEIYYDREAFEDKLTEYLYWYNYKRPHASLNYQTPVAFIQNHIPKCR